MKILKRLFLLGVLWGTSHLIYIVLDGLYDNGRNADAAVVLGSKVNPDGTLSARLHARLQQGLLLYKQKRVKKIIVSGGFGREGFYEADKMREFLLAQGVPDEDIFVDNQGSDTEKTAENSLAIMQANNLHSLISVSQYFHQTRVKMLFRKAGFDDISSSSPYFFENWDFYSVPREVVAFYVEWLK